MKIFRMSFCAVLAALSTAANAATVEFSASGVFSTSSTSEISIGDSFSLSLVFDDAVADDVSVAGIGLYNFTPELSSAVSINGVNYSLGAGAVTVLDDAGASQDVVNAGFGGNSQTIGTDQVVLFGVSLKGDTSVFSGDGLNAFGGIFSSLVFELYLDGEGFPGTVGTISSVSYGPVSAVPLPASGTLLLAGFGGLATFRRLKKNRQ